MIRRISRTGKSHFRRFVLAMLAFVLVFAPAAQAQNTPPVADAGPDQSIYVSWTTRLPGSAYDQNGNVILAWLWAVESAPVGSSPIISDSARPNPTFEADLPGDYILSLVASDGMDWSQPDYVTIHVARVPIPLTIGGPWNIHVGQPAMLLGCAGTWPRPIESWLWTLESSP